MKNRDGRRQWALTIGVSALCALGVAGSAAAQTTNDDQPDVRTFIDAETGERVAETGERVGPSLRADGSPKDPSADEDHRVVFDLVSGGDRVTSYDRSTDSAPSRVDVPLAQAIFEDSPADLRFVIFDSVALVDDLSPDAKQALLEGFEAGTTIIGAEGTGRELKRALDLIAPDLYAAGTTTGGAGLWVLLQRSRDGHLNELTIAAPSDEESRQEAFRLAWNWYDRNAVADAPPATDAPLVTYASAATYASTATDASTAHTAPPAIYASTTTNTSTATDDSDSPWNAIHNFEWTGTVYATFEGTPNEHAGTYSFLLSVYFLDDAEDQDTDYYRLDFGTVVGISEYEMTGNDFGDTSGKCGWWTADQQVAATVTTSGGQWWPTGYMPDTTVGSTSTTFTIGGDIGTSGPSANASYSQSYGTSDVTIDVYTNSVDEWLRWEATLVGCHDFGDYPDYSGASDAAKTTYSLDPSFIAAVPQGTQLTFTTEADDGNDQWGFTVQKDKIDCATACIPPPHIHSYFGPYTQSVSGTCDSSGCT
ncbi:MAG: hypothetical protein AAFX81_10465 [Pseudomonadota bacterium]